jgi:hypothetical protein
MGPNGPSARQATEAGNHSCLQLRRHQYEVCFAYIANASYLARLPFYKLGRSTNPDIARTFREHFESRYTQAARAFIERQTAQWPPPGQLDVFLPTIRIISVSVAADLSTATLATRETWLVRTEGGATLFAENNVSHTISLARVKSKILHKWVVTNIV